MELLKAIALLCQVSSDSYYHYIHEKQLSCQKYYIKCVDDKHSKGKIQLYALKECINERK